MASATTLEENKRTAQRIYDVWDGDDEDALAKYATGGTYVNLISEREGEESMAYRENYDRLVELKDEYDPTNLFRMNQNIEPTVE